MVYFSCVGNDKVNIKEGDLTFLYIDFINRIDKDPLLKNFNKIV